IHNLAHQIWPSTFGKILSSKQLQYMLDWMYSPTSLRSQMKKAHQFLLLKENEKYLGYCSYHQQEATTILQKIYLLPEKQGQGLGKLLLYEVIERAKISGSRHLRLNVNRYNKAVDFYKKEGFRILYQEDNPIGNGFYMNDYVMER